MIKGRSRYRNYLSLEAFVVLAILAVNQSVVEYQMKAFVAGLIFMVNALGILVFEMRHPGFQRKSSFWGCLVFLCIGSIPSLVLRIMSWGIPFDLVSFGGISGREIEAASHILFAVMILCFFIDSYQEQKRILQS